MNTRRLELTEAEETALVNLFLFVHDLGVPPHLEEDDAFDTLWEKVSEPSPFDYVQTNSQTVTLYAFFLRRLAILCMYTNGFDFETT